MSAHASLELCKNLREPWNPHWNLLSIRCQVRWPLWPDARNLTREIDSFSGFRMQAILNFICNKLSGGDLQWLPGSRVCNARAADRKGWCFQLWYYDVGSSQRPEKLQCSFASRGDLPSGLGKFSLNSLSVNHFVCQHEAVTTNDWSLMLAFYNSCD